MLVCQHVRICTYTYPTDLIASLRPDKLDGIRLPAVHMVYTRPLSINICQSSFCLRNLWSNKLHLASIVHVQSPLNDVKHMCTPICNISATEIPMPAPPRPFIIFDRR